MRQVDGGHPVEVLCADRVDVNRQLDTLVGNLTHVGRDGAEGIDIGRNGVVPDEVLGLLMIELDGTVDAVLEESEVDTDVEHTRALPLQVGVRVLRSSECAPALTIIIEEARCAISSVSGIGTEAHRVTRDTITGTELQV